MIWGCFKGNVNDPLYYSQKSEGNIAAQRYINNILRPLAHQFWKA